MIADLRNAHQRARHPSRLESRLQTLHSTASVSGLKVEVNFAFIPDPVAIGCDESFPIPTALGLLQGIAGRILGRIEGTLPDKKASMI